MRIFSVYHCCLAVLLSSAMLFSVDQVNGQLYGPGDPILAIDLDGNSSFPVGETPANAADQDSMTKYLNFGGRDTGLIVTPNFGASVVQGIQMTTANDFPERDPSSFVIYGTNDPISSADCSLGDQETWTLIAASPIVLPDDRFSPSEIVDFANGASYTSYKIIIDDIKDANVLGIMQVADIQLYTGLGGTGDQILADGDPALAVNDDPNDFCSYPASEAPTNTIDGTLAKYLNFGEQNSGFIVSRADGASVIIDGFTITTANDFEPRDPASYELYGTNEPIQSTQNSTGDLENWTLVQAGDLALPSERDTESDPVAVKNTTGYTAYRVIFPTVKDAGGANSMQLAEMTFTGEISDILVGDVNCDGEVNLLDVQPFVNVLTGVDPFTPKADINGDGNVDLLDVTPFVNLLSGG